MLNGCVRWAEEDDIRVAHGYRLAANKRGGIARAFQIEAAPSQYHSNAGKLYEEPDVTGHPFALRGTCKLTRTGERINEDQQFSQQACVAGGSALAAINAAADAGRQAAFGAWV